MKEENNSPGIINSRFLFLQGKNHINTFQIMFVWCEAVLKYIVVETFHLSSKDLFLSSQYPTSNEWSKNVSMQVYNNDQQKKKNPLLLKKKRKKNPL